MKAIAKAKNPPAFSTLSDTPARPDDDDRSAGIAFYFLMGMLVVGLLYFIGLGIVLVL